MSRRDDERIADILDAASEIAEIIELGREAWDKDRIRRLAVERLLEIVGEAANSLSSSRTSAPPDDRQAVVRRICRFRASSCPSCRSR